METNDRSDLERLESENRRLNRRIERLLKEMSNLSNLQQRVMQLRDYSEREKQLQYEYNYLMLENAPDMLFILDMQMRFRLGTKMFLKLLGHPDPGTLYDMPIDKVLKLAMPTEWIDKVTERLGDVIKYQNQVDYTDEVALDAETRIFSICISPAIDSTGEIMGVVATMHDLTDLYRMKDNAEAATKAKSSFLASMSHEIRTPLNAVIGMAEIARRRAEEENAELAGNIDEIIIASRHLLGILNDVLDFSKIESGKLTLAIESFSLQHTIKTVRSIIGHRCQEKGITLEVTVNGNADIVIFSDELRLKQVLINLLGNAVKFTGDNGTVGLVVDSSQICDGSVQLRFRVTDTGIGMSKEQMKNLFTAFEQADSTIARRFGGTGLGLAISQKIVNEMGGEITVSSAPAEGSEFSFQISVPASETMEVYEEQSIYEEFVLDLTGKTIMLVEDIAINRIIIIELLRDTNAKIVEVENGTDAIEDFTASEIGGYDLIFMDIQMPGIDGYETTRRIRALDREDAATIPIVAMTANAYKEDIDRAMDSGMTAHLSKPVETGQLMEVLQRLLLPNMH